MIGVEGKCVFRFDLGSMEDFISDLNLISFTLEEWAGGQLPTFVLTAEFFDTKILNYLNELSELKIHYGTTKDNKKIQQFKIARKSIKSSGGKIDVYLSGHLDRTEWFKERRVSISKNMSGVERLRELATNNGFNNQFNVNEANITESQDFMRWIQYGQSDAEHARDVCLHSFLRGSCPLMAINIDRDFIVKDLVSLTTTVPKWIFRNSDNLENNILPYSGVRETEIVSGLMNVWLGYDKSVGFDDIEYNNEIIKDSDLKSTMTITKDFDMQTNIERVPDNFRLNDNMHSNYWKAYQQNLRWLALYSSVVTKIYFKDYFKPIFPLDFITIYDNNEGNQDTPDIGDYIVAGTRKQYTKNGLTTGVFLNKEALNIVREA